MPSCEGFRFLLVARCDLSGWVEVKPLCNFLSRAVANFFQENIICRHGCFGKLIINRGFENKKAMADFASRYWVKRVVLLAYHPQANDMIDRGHKLIMDALSKMSDGGCTNWVQNLPLGLWTDWSTVWASTGLTLHYSNCDNKLVFPIELEVTIWQILLWDQVYSTSELLALRARQFQRQDENLEEAAFHFNECDSKKKNVTTWSTVFVKKS